MSTGGRGAAWSTSASSSRRWPTARSRSGVSLSPRSPPAPTSASAPTSRRREILGGIVRGAVEAIAMSEPEAGSDVGALRCKAVRENGGYTINGQKTWISEAHVADHILLVCRTDDSGSKHEGADMLSIPKGAEGVEIRGIETMGGRIVNDVFFDDCQIPAENLLGGRRPGLDAADGRPQRRAPDHRRAVAGHRPAGDGRHARLRQGAQAVRPPDRQLPDDRPPARRSGDRARVQPPAHLRRRRRGSTPTRPRSSRARPRWRSSR